MSLSAYEEPSRTCQAKRQVEPLFDLATAVRSLPLVDRILQDVMAASARMAHLRLEHQRLLASPAGDWPTRTQLFEAADRLEAARVALGAAVEEVASLGVDVLDPVRGTGGFPTIVNGSLAHFVYGAGSGTIRHWSYRQRPMLRPVPDSWFEPSPTLDAGLAQPA